MAMVEEKVEVGTKVEAERVTVDKDVDAEALALVLCVLAHPKP